MAHSSNPSAERPPNAETLSQKTQPQTADVLITRLDSAKAAISQAEGELQAAIAEIQAAPRADKIAIGEALSLAFSELRGAKTALVALETEIAGGSTEGKTA
jgi:hypothetical protein